MEGNALNVWVTPGGEKYITLVCLQVNSTRGPLKGTEYS